MSVVLLNNYSLFSNTVNIRCRDRTALRVEAEITKFEVISGDNFNRLYIQEHPE